MALTVDQWFAKVKKFVPGWFFEKDVVSPGVFRAIATVMQGIQQDTDDGVSSTFILESPEPIIDLLGDERSVARRDGETTPVFAPRVQRIFNDANPESLQAIIDGLLIKGTATIREHNLLDQADKIFIGQSYINRRELFSTLSYNTFSVIIDKQSPVPNSYIGQCYMSRGDYIGTDESSQVVLDLLASVINNSKAAGTLYRIFERSA